MRSVFTLVLVLCLAGCQAAPVKTAPPRPVATKDRVSISADGLDLKDVLDALRKQVGTGIRIAVDPKVQEVVTVCNLSGTLDEVLSVLAKITRCELEERDGVLTFVQKSMMLTTCSGISAQTALECVAAYAGRRLIGPEVPGDLPPGRIEERDWLSAMRKVLALAAPGEFEIRRRGKATVEVVIKPELTKQLRELYRK